MRQKSPYAWRIVRKLLLYEELTTREQNVVLALIPEETPEADRQPLVPAGYVHKYPSNDLLRSHFRMQIPFLNAVWLERVRVILIVSHSECHGDPAPFSDTLVPQKTRPEMLDRFLQWSYQRAAKARHRSRIRPRCLATNRTINRTRHA